jgi:excisionase family DNA binding protein
MTELRPVPPSVARGACYARVATFIVMTTWLTTQDAAEYATISPDMIRAAVKAGDLKAYAIGKGREYRLTASDVDEWLMSRSWEPKGAKYL